MVVFLWKISSTIIINYIILGSNVSMSLIESDGCEVFTIIIIIIII